MSIQKQKPVVNNKVKEILKEYKDRYKQQARGFKKDGIYPNDWDDGFLAGLAESLIIFGYSEDELDEIRADIYKNA